MTAPKVLITATDYPTRCPEGWQLLADAGVRAETTPYDRPLTLSEITTLMPGIRGVIAGVDPWDGRAFDHAPDLQVIARFGVGLDSIDLAEAERRRILVRNVPGGNAEPVAEMAILSMLASLRDLTEVAEATQQGAWSRPVGRELGSETVGLLGFGDIGRRVARMLRGFGSTVLACDPYADSHVAETLGVRLVDRDELLRRSTIVSLHLPATPDTEHTVNEEFLAGMRPEAVLINTARGSLVDSVALAKAVTAGIIARAAVDVFENEPVTKDEPLLGVRGIIATPHMSAETDGAYRRIGIATARIIIDALTSPQD